MKRSPEYLRTTGHTDCAPLPCSAWSGKPRSRHPWMPPRRGRTCLMPRRRKVSAARALLASLGQLQ